jgi:uncharacterized membrane protein
MFTVHAIDRIQNINLDIISNPDIFLNISWVVSVVGFIILFSYSLFKYRNIQLTLKYSVSLASIVAMVFGILTLSNFIKDTTYKTQADQSIVPQNVQMIQTNDSEVVVTWTTQKAVLGFISYHKPGGDQLIAVDIQRTTPVTTHRVVIRELEKNIVYSLEIRNGGEVFDQYQGRKLEIVLH